MAGRPPLPSNVHQLRGNPGKRARNDKEPEPDVLQDLAAPAHLPTATAAVWDQLAPQLKKAGVLTTIDTPALEMACDAIATFRLCMEKTAEGRLLQKNAETGSISLSPWTMVKSMAYKQALAVLREFGATPSARSRVTIDPQGELFGKESAGTGTDGGHYDA